ncbi:hypothetical protein FZO89_01670 [Luteimonas viscosa]|uniref:Uncharacterized protein n=1 Tax=Luteimonas viscosa TaxID=1132694 RepID=A0A5D4XM97_9GAMM|nr:hypothetical protein [Luteimonas viscosa]TYT25085.1 hypothetical protein FZO89_01670 [Luteimonas viscosa]
MSGNRIRDDAAPWSFFLPVVAAVIVGILVAGWIQWAIGTVFEGRERVARLSGPVATDPAPEAPPGVAPAEATPAAGPEAVAAEAAPPAAASREPSRAQAATPPANGPVDTAAALASPPELPGAIVARRDGAPAACINGTVALRDANGWQQQLENDAPVACTEQSTAPRP